MTRKVIESSPFVLPDHALVYVREELETAASEFKGPLAQSLREFDLDTPFSLLPSEAANAAMDLRHGGVDQGEADNHLAASLSAWLGRPDPGRRRLVVLEESLALGSDPDVGASWQIENRIYYVAQPGESNENVRRALRCLTGYPGIGVLTRPPMSLVPAVASTREELAVVADYATAILVRAWDDEAFVVVPIGGRLRPDELRCAAGT